MDTLRKFYLDLQARDIVAVASVFVAMVSLFVSAFSARYTAKTFGRMLARDQRDALFKAFESYLKIRDLRAKAEASAARPDWETYYRALFDLQWSEFYIWREGALADRPYRIWLEQHHAAFRDDEHPPQTIQPEISYRVAWQYLIDTRYFAANDPFVTHMNRVHAGHVTEALKTR